MTPADPLDLRATPPRMRIATRAADLSEAATRRALELATATPSMAEWRRFLSAALGLLGTCLVLAGVVSFVAYNWARLGRFGKFALAEAAITAVCAVAWIKLPRFSGQLATFAAAVLVGPLLAIYGQTYQTGADPYGLFLTWAALIVPWALAANFGATWVLALLLGDLSLALYYAQVVDLSRLSDGLLLPLLIAGLHAVAVLVWEWQSRRPAPSIDEPWALRTLALVGLAALWIPAAALVLFDTRAGSFGALGLAGLAAALAGSLRYYGRVRPDRFIVTAAVVAGMTWITVLAGRVVLDLLELDVFGLVLMAAFVVGQITVGLKWYRSARAT